MVDKKIRKTCPCCKEDMGPANPQMCSCPTLVYIPPGEHIHVDCPVHGKRKVYGGGNTNA